jgi:hypothetical protein
MALLVSEGLARLVLHPENYLHVELIKDDILGEALPPNTPGYDEWGFRNLNVPKQIDIVAVGDSHTFGNTAQMDESWPHVLAKLSGMSVYNMGMGGYGPNQYFHLFKTKAISLNPKIIICGLYMGDDFENAFSITYGLPHWSYLRELPDQKVNYDIWDVPVSVSWHKKIRVWLSRHSVIYMLVFHGPLLGKINGDYQIKNASQINPDATTLNVSSKGISEAFLPKGIFRRLDQDNGSVREGMRITFKLLQDMNSISQQHGIKFIVAVIPTKEMVFADYIEHKKDLPLVDVVDKLIANERIARLKTFQFFNDSGIAYVDTLPLLKQSIEQGLYAHTASDMHPNNNGYKVIAETINNSLSKNQQ